MTSGRIAIVGGGPGGLTLARVLQVHGIKAVVFEREGHSAARSQGRSLDMHAESGQYAIECAGLTEEFRKIARYEDQQMRVYGKDGVLRFLEEDGSETGDRPEVDRGQLRQMLLDSLPEGMVRWGRELTGVEAAGDGFDLRFRGGERERFDLVVGADGAWSRIRPLVSAAKPAYSGVTMFEMGIEDADRRFPELAARVGRGLMFALGDGRAVIGHRGSDGHVGIYAGLRVGEDWLETMGLAGVSGEGLRAGLAAEFPGWAEGLTELILRAGDEIEPRQIHALPVGHRWEHRAGVTLLGDASHVMSPFGGDGANLAMWDGADLALRLAGSSDWEGAVREYEERMFVRAESSAAGAAGAIQEVFSDDGLRHMVGHMQQHREP